ncbi:uncharacterized protein [Lolium perenne]|uniref:uncharacterized protein n=1 Tax=Lolium perenne TaxID=4522 RepID=UPI0021EAE477
MAYKAEYKNEAFIGDVVTRTRPLSDGATGTSSRTGTLAFVFRDRAGPDAELVVVAFHGTAAFNTARCADLDPSLCRPGLGSGARNATLGTVDHVSGASLTR